MLLALNIFAAFVLATSGGTATSTPIESYTLCLREQVPKLDDHTSDATTIVKALRSICGLEYEALLKDQARINGRDGDNAYISILRGNLDPIFDQGTLGLVLKERKQRH